MSFLFFLLYHSYHLDYHKLEIYIHLHKYLNKEVGENWSDLEKHLCIDYDSFFEDLLCLQMSTEN